MPETNTPLSSSRFGILSFVLMFVPILIIFVMALIIYPLFGKLPTSIERVSVVLFAVIPPLLGFIFAINGLTRKEPRKWLHIIGLIFNLLESLYFGLLVLIAS